jgi:hypothetical protein
MGHVSHIDSHSNDTTLTLSSLVAMLSSSRDVIRSSGLELPMSTCIHASLLYEHLTWLVVSMVLL